MNIDKLEKILQYTFTNKSILQEAITHPSKKLENKHIKTYQRLEFLGDKILNFVIANELFLHFPNETEGEISQRHAHLVCGDVCHKIAQNLNIIPFVLFSKAHLNDILCNNVKIAEDVIEAIIGAIFVDSDINNAQNFIIQNWKPYITQNITPPKDSKSTLQEYFQKHFKHIPKYIITPSDSNFTATIYVDEKKFEATASTKKEAEKLVAKKCLEAINH